MKGYKVSMLSAAIVISFMATSKAACSLTLYKKTTSAKTVYTSKGETISAKTVEKLKSDCAITTKVMSSYKKKQLEIARLNKKLAKLKAAQGKK